MSSCLAPLTIMLVISMISFAHACAIVHFRVCNRFIATFGIIEVFNIVYFYAAFDGTRWRCTDNTFSMKQLTIFKLLLTTHHKVALQRNTHQLLTTKSECLYQQKLSTSPRLRLWLTPSPIKSVGDTSAAGRSPEIVAPEQIGAGGLVVMINKQTRLQHQI